MFSSKPFKVVLWMFVLQALMPALHAQEIKSNVQVIAPSIQMTNKQIFTTLQNTIVQFINNKKWTDDQFEAKEKIEISILIEVTGMAGNNDEFTGVLQIQSSRPVFNSSYKSPLLNYRDDDIYFKYREFESLEFQEGQNLNDLTSLLAFYVYVVLGLDYNSFGDEGGAAFLSKAQNIANVCQTRPGWDASAGKGGRNKFNLAENLTNARFKPMHKLYYNYHRKGLDQFYEKPDEARSEITAALKSVQDLVSILPNAVYVKTFFNTKVSELIEIYKGATAAEKVAAFNLLVQLDPANRQKYEAIKS